MKATDGANIPEAIKQFRAAGWSVREIADSLNLHTSTIYRWANSTRRPNPENYAALVELVDAKYAQEVHRRQPRPAVLMHLEAAHTALKTAEERAALDALAVEIRQHLADGEAQRRGELAQVPQQRQPYRSITHDVDPFLLAGAKPEPALF